MHFTHTRPPLTRDSANVRALENYFLYENVCDTQSRVGGGKGGILLRATTRPPCGSVTVVSRFSLSLSLSVFLSDVGLESDDEIFLMANAYFNNSKMLIEAYREKKVLTYFVVPWKLLDILCQVVGFLCIHYTVTIL